MSPTRSNPALARLLARPELVQARRDAEGIEVYELDAWPCLHPELGDLVSALPSVTSTRARSR